MIKHKLLQHSQEWHEIRYAKVSGTRSKGLFVESDTLCLEIVAEKTEPFNDTEISDFINKDMQRGQDLEPYARKELIEVTGIDFKEYGWCQSEQYDILGISPDGCSSDDRFMCEIKCPSRKKHIQTIIENQIPLDNINQCIHYFMVNPKLEVLYFMSYRPENIVSPHFIKALRRNDIVNLGTKSKPILKPVSEWVELGLEKVAELNEKVNNIITRLLDRNTF